MEVYIIINILISISAILHIFCIYSTFQALKTGEFYETNKMMAPIIEKHKFITVLISTSVFVVLYLINYMKYFLFCLYELEYPILISFLIRGAPSVLFLIGMIYDFTHDLILLISYKKGLIK